jgi:hypothetical protein
MNLLLAGTNGVLEIEIRDVITVIKVRIITWMNAYGFQNNQHGA